MHDKSFAPGATTSIQSEKVDVSIEAWNIMLFTPDMSRLISYSHL